MVSSVISRLWRAFPSLGVWDTSLISLKEKSPNCWRKIPKFENNTAEKHETPHLLLSAPPGLFLMTIIKCLYWQAVCVLSRYHGHTTGSMCLYLFFFKLTAKSQSGQYCSKHYRPSVVSCFPLIPRFEKALLLHISCLHIVCRAHPHWTVQTFAFILPNGAPQRWEKVKVTPGGGGERRKK